MNKNTKAVIPGKCIDSFGKVRNGHEIYNRHQWTYHHTSMIDLPDKEVCMWCGKTPTQILYGV